jgi:hypothetical protein
MHAVICENKGVCFSGFIALNQICWYACRDGNFHVLLTCICEVTSNITFSVLLLI